MCDEDVLEKYMDSGNIDDEDIRKLIFERKLVPCYFGSALKLDGVEEILDGLEKYTLKKSILMNLERKYIRYQEMIKIKG